MNRYLTLQWGYGPGLLECLICGAVVVPDEKADLHAEWHKALEALSSELNDDQVRSQPKREEL